MNLDLIDPFVLAQECPDVVIGQLHSGHATCLRFNQKGDYLASGRYDGLVVIFDMETHSIARRLRGHTKQVQSLSWSKCGRYLLSSSQDWRCVLWDLADGSRVRTVRFTAPVFAADMHPDSHFVFVASLFEEQPVLVDATDERPIKYTLASAPKRHPSDITDKTIAWDAKQHTTVSIFSHSGKYILAGTNKGWLNIIDTASHQIQYSAQVSGGILTLIKLGPAQSESIVLNSSDRIVRTVRLPQLESDDVDLENFRIADENKYHDIVNGTLWNYATFSASGEYVVASINVNHNLYLWETTRHSLEKILEGPKEELSMVEVSPLVPVPDFVRMIDSGRQWHPNRPFLAAIGVDSGNIYLWSVIAPQRWSALAPDFSEVEENVEYVEREDEFDVLPEEELNKRIQLQEDEEIDILTIEPSKRAGEYQDTDFKMPVVLDIEDSDSEDEVEAIGAGQYRRKSPGRGKDWATT